MPRRETVQLPLVFERPTCGSLKEAIRRGVYACGRPIKEIASALDMGATQLSRKLSDNPNDPQSFPADRLDDLMRATGDLTPLYYLIDMFLTEPRERDLREFAEFKRNFANVEAFIGRLKGDL